MKYDLDKNIQILNYFAEKNGGSINYTKILKLIFFSDKLFLRKYWRLITGDIYSAMKMWPVASSTYQLISNPEVFNEHKILENLTTNWYDIVSNKKTDLDYFAEDELKILDTVYETFKEYDYKQISDLTHNYEEWKKHDWVVDAQSSSPMNILDFFIDSLWQNSIFNESQEDLELSKDIYIQAQSIYA